MPTDPAEWNTAHVRSWLKWSTRQFSLNPEPDADKFPTSGAELLELSRAEFEAKAGSSRAGRLLAIHLAHLRHSVTGRSSSPLHDHVDLDDEEEQGKWTSNQQSSVCLPHFPLGTNVLGSKNNRLYSVVNILPKSCSLSGIFPNLRRKLHLTFYTFS
jgi:hypothetical protein